MRVQILSVQNKDIKTKAGQAMTLRVVQGVSSGGDVFKSVLPKQHPDITIGQHEIGSEVYVNYDAEIATRPIFTPVGK